MKEIERKQLIAKEKYLDLTEFFTLKCVPDRKLQINYYYDTLDYQLLKENETLRIRQIEDKLKLEYKYNKTAIDNVRVCEEYSKALYELPLTIKNPLFTDKDDSYRNIGFLITDRTNFDFGEMLVSLDKNYYLGTVDYEIEVETSVFSDLPDFMKELNFDFAISTISKYSRFIDKLKSR
jgi:uncharacterized protein YjbK